MATTDQESFWQGEFGDQYTDRNRGERLVAANVSLFRRVLERTAPIQSVLELGSNVGLNLMAFRQLLPEVAVSAVEINEKAASELRKNLPDVDLHRTSISEFQPARTWDLVFTKGVLIHIPPEQLPATYARMHACSARYVLVCEYYSPAPVEIPYRGQREKLFKRDFAGEILDTFPDLNLVDYGFVYRRDPSFPQDDISWFLMEKRT